MPKLTKAEPPFNIFFFWHYTMQLAMGAGFDAFDDEKDWLQPFEQDLHSGKIVDTHVWSVDDAEGKAYKVKISDLCAAAQGIASPELADFMRELREKIPADSAAHQPLITSMHSGSSDYWKVSDLNKFLDHVNSDAS